MNILITNARIYTVNPAQPWASAIAIANDRIIAVGADHELADIHLPHMQRADMGGAFIMPGMMDAHLHLQWTGLAMRQVDVFEAPSVRAAVERVRARAASTPRGEWIQGGGWMQSLWENEAFATAADLDAATREHPVALSAKSGHALWVNSLALQLAGITSATPDPEGGQFVRDASGNPTGTLLENAMDAVYRVIPPPSLEAQDAATIAVMRAMNQRGLTGAHCMDGDAAATSFKTYQRLRLQDKLTLRIVKQLPAAELDSTVKAGIHSGLGDCWLRIGGVKIFADGALGPRTAAMLEPYEGDPANTGISTIEREELVEMVLKANANRLAVVVHAIGDRANHDVLDAIEISKRENGAVSAPLRNRIEHAQVLHPADVQRFAQLGVIASMQPIHATQDMLMADSHWGKRSAYAYAFRALRDAGARLAFGSDSPVETFDPLVGIHAAVTRRRADGTPGPDGWYPEQRLSIAETIEGFTLGAAYAGGMDHEIGSLEAGKLADLAVLSRNLLDTPPDELLDAKVERVMLNGAWIEGD